MKKLVALLSEELRDAFQECGYDEKYGNVTFSNRPDLCQFQCNGALAAAKQYKKAPIMIANEVVESIRVDPSKYSLLEVIAPGFINISLNPIFLAEYLQNMSVEDRFGFEKCQKPLNVIVDYGGANVAKPLHVGHLRPAIIGESIKRIQLFAGHHVIGDVHLGDWGLPMGLIIAELEERLPDLPYFDKSFTGVYPETAPFTISELEEIYPFASTKSKEDESFRLKAQYNTARLQEGEPGLLALWKHIMDVSITDLKKNYDNLNVHFDLWKGESDAQPYMKNMVQDMEKQGIAMESQGALVVDIQEETDTKEFPPCIIRKSDGAFLYATSDLATMLEREKLYQPDWYIYVVDKRQEMYFTQVFRTAKKAYIVPDERRLDFLGFGTMNGKDGKPFKTRSGGVLRLEALVENINEAVYNRVIASREIPEEEARKTAKVVGLAALKYGDLSNQASKDYIFDVERFSSFEGDTGPYILYTMVRIKSILRKYTELTGNSTEGLVCSLNKRNCALGEMELMLAASRFQDVIEQASKENAPQRICQYIYDLANVFSSFYHENKIIDEEDKQKQIEWVALIVLVLRLLECGVELLGFEAPEQM